ncbi:MAG: hypothetical protein QOG04_662 [Actinomycetota bacterium]|jgi:hypothetical protein|nr:hypothetical protein [Actinomycetota bacterium]
MSFEDRLRDQFRRADASVPGDRLDWNTTIMKARRQRMKFAALTAVAAVSVLGIAAYAVINMNDQQPKPIAPASSATPAEESPSATPTASPTASPEDGTRGPCSASGMEGTHYPETGAGLPTKVADVRLEIIGAAIGCDYDGLETLALEGRQGFSYNYGADGSPADFWRVRERDARANGQPTSEYMRYLVSILDLPYCEEDGPDGEHYFVWPRVHCNARTDSDWNDLKGLYTKEQIDQMRTGDMYYGFRVGILEDGDWVYFISGD